MRVLVTGGAGFIGSNLVRLLVREKGAEVVNVDRLTYAGNLRSLGDVIEDPGHVFEQADICDAGALKTLFERHRPDGVIHLAAESHVDRSIDGPGQFIRTNILGTCNLLEAALDHYGELDAAKRGRFRFLHVSTDEAYGSPGEDDPAFTETTPYAPHSPYSASKAASDHLARAWRHTYGLPVIVTNCSNNYGPCQFPEKLIPVVILKALNGENIPVYGKGENVRDWLYVEDHAEALHLVMTRGTAGQTYNIGGNTELRNIDLVKILCEILDEMQPRADKRSYAEQITFVRDRPGHDFRYAMDCSRIRSELGWEPRVGAVDGLRKTVAWYLGNRGWWEDILNGSYRLERLGTGNRRQGTGET